MLEASRPTSVAFARLSDIADINPRLHEKPDASDVVAFVPMSALSADTASVVAETSRTYGEVAKGYTPFQNNDVLVAKITPCFENNKIGQANLTRPIGFGSTEFHVIRPFEDMADPRYVMHYLRQDHLRAEGERKMTGSAGQRRVPEHFLAGLKIPLPSLAGQRRIVTILDQADGLRAKRRATLARLDELARAAFLELFGNPLTNPKGWRRVRTADVAAVVTGNTPPRANAAYYGTGIEWLKSDNLGTGSYYATKAAEQLAPAGRGVARTAPPQSILVTCIAGSPDSIGNAAMLDREAAFNQQINALVPKLGNPHFLYAQLRVGKALVQESSTGAMKGMVSKSRFEGISLIFPPAEQQDAFARVALAIEAQRRVAERAARETDALFASVQHRAFRGEL